MKSKFTLTIVMACIITFMILLVGSIDSYAQDRRLPSRPYLIRFEGCQYVLIERSIESVAITHHGACDNHLK